MSTIKARHFHLIDDLDIAALALAMVEHVEAFSVKVVSVLRTWVRRSQDRRMLANMSGHMLDDIGLTPGDIDREVNKYFWQI